jgi:leucyl aminopeptidase (aminopeptidase T)
VFDQPVAMRGKMLQGLNWEFKNGHLTSFSAAANLDVFKGLYEKSSGDKDRLANLVIGLNPNAELIGFNDRIVLGTASIGIGGNKSIGGANEAEFGHEQTLRKPTIEVDGQKLVVDGRI